MSTAAPPDDGEARGKDGRREILFLTATRADFGKLKPLIERVRPTRRRSATASS